MVWTNFVSQIAKASRRKALVTAPMYKAARTISCLRSLRLERRHAMLAGLVASWFLAQPLAYADEFDVLSVYSGARPVNDDWQVCAASFAKRRLGSPETPELLADQAFSRCQTAERSLSRFLVAKVGRESADGVMTLLRDKYRSGLAAAIRELRMRGRQTSVRQREVGSPIVITAFLVHATPATSAIPPASQRPAISRVTTKDARPG